MEEYGKYSVPGRPPLDPKHRVARPVRCLVTSQVANLIMSTADDIHAGMVLSDYIRLALYNQLKADGQMSPELEADATWTSLRANGYL